MGQQRTTEDDIFFQNMLPHLQEMEKLRQARLKAYEGRQTAGAIFATFAAPLCVLADIFISKVNTLNPDGMIIAVTPAMIFGVIAWVREPKRQYIKAYKQDILPYIARLLGGLTYDPQGSIPIKTLKLSRILPSHTRYRAEDYFSTMCGDIQAVFSEIHLDRSAYSGGRVSYETTFKGLAILLTLPERLSGHTALIGKGGLTLFGFKVHSSRLTYLEMKHEETDGMFDVYTNNQDEARRIVTPSLVARIKQLCDTHNAEYASLAYFSNQILIMLPSRRDYFEPNLNRPIAHMDAIMDMKREIKMVLDIAEDYASAGWGIGVP